MPADSGGAGGSGNGGGLVAALRAIHADTIAAVDGEALVRAALDRLAPPVAPRPRVLAMGKAALPMLRGLAAAVGPIDRALAITTERALGRDRGGWPPEVQIVLGDHPAPTARSAAAAEAALAMVNDGGDGDTGGAGSSGAPLVVLLSGGTSALVAAPAPGLSLDDKRAAAAAMATGGATIRALNAVRKHLSAIKGGRLALRARGPVQVLAISDVVGDDPSVIGSGPFAADPSTFADAIAAAAALGVVLPAAAAAHLARGARGEIPETPKPGDPRLAGVVHHLIAGPAAVVAAAQRAAAARGLALGPALPRNTELDVAALAAEIVARAAHELAAGDPPPAGGGGGGGGAARRPRILIGNGEPRIAVPAGAGRGGRSTHLALLVAEGLARLLPPDARGRVAFLAAGTDDRDGSAGDQVTGAVVDGGTWERAARQAAAGRGLAPAEALARFDSATALDSAGALAQGIGTSNLLDLHLLVVA